MMKKQTIDDYLETARKLKITPNFWLGRKYLKSIESEISVEKNETHIWIQEGEWVVFPPLPLNPLPAPYFGLKDMRIWSDFPDYPKGSPIEFLDWEYTYDSYRFADMSGKAWQVFRKNARKWPKRNESWAYTSDVPNTSEIEQLLIGWLESKSETEVHDSDSMIYFLMENEERSFLYQKDRLIGINSWEETNGILIYRHCITRPSEAFSQEFIRILFYLQNPNRIVIDGGTLGNEGLERFKDKLNPISKRKIHSFEL